MNLKTELSCNICKLVLKLPINLPCNCVVCGEHEHNTNGRLKCVKCNQEFDIPQAGFPANEMVKNILAKNFHLGEEEKTLYNSFQSILKQLKQLEEEVSQRPSDMELSNFEHFADIRRKIDSHREVLKTKIDVIALKMIEQTKEKEKAYLARIKRPFLQIDAQKSTDALLNEFRKPNSKLDDVKRLMTEHEHFIKQWQAKLAEFDSLHLEIDSVDFKVNNAFLDEVVMVID